MKSSDILLYVVLTMILYFVGGALVFVEWPRCCGLTDTMITTIGWISMICGMVLSGIGIYEWQTRKKQ